MKILVAKTKNEINLLRQLQTKEIEITNLKDDIKELSKTIYYLKNGSCSSFQSK